MIVDLDFISLSLHLGREKKSASIVRMVFWHPFLLTSSLPGIKKGRCPSSESDMYVCDLCNRTFSTQTSLKRHRQSVHHQSDSFSCQVCGQRFYRKDVLQRHLKTHRPAVEVRRDAAVEVRRDLLDVSADASVDPPPPPPPPPSPSPVPPPPETHTERPVCNLCARSFASQKTLKRHRETVHRQSDGFSCRVCD